MAALKTQPARSLPSFGMTDMDELLAVLMDGWAAYMEQVGLASGFGPGCVQGAPGRAALPQKQQWRAFPRSAVQCRSPGESALGSLGRGWLPDWSAGGP